LQIIQEQRKEYHIHQAVDMGENYHFNLEDPEWIEYLKSFGYVVVKNVASTDEVRNASTLLRRDLENVNIPPRGLIASLAQSEGAWSIRGIKQVKEVFAKIWEKDDLIVSMDAILAWKKWKGYDTLVNDSEFPDIPRKGKLHLDQNPFDKPYFDCMQGMMPLLPVTEETGGLQVVPMSHLDENKIEFKKRYPSMKGIGDWCPLDTDDPLYQDALLIKASPGDLILWDSRTIHGGKVGTGNQSVIQRGISVFMEDEKENVTVNARNVDSNDDAVNVEHKEATPPSIAPLVRLSVCVTMSPRAKATAQILKERKEGFDSGIAFNHCPHDTGPRHGPNPIQKLPQHINLHELNSWQTSLL